MKEMVGGVSYYAVKGIKLKICTSYIGSLLRWLLHCELTLLRLLSCQILRLSINFLY